MILAISNKTSSATSQPSIGFFKRPIPMAKQFASSLVKITSMYPYHNKIKQRIKNQELTGYEFVEKYKNIAPCLLLYFDTEPKVRPIREHRFEEYNAILDGIK